MREMMGRAGTNTGDEKDRGQGRPHCGSLRLCGFGGLGRDSEVGRGGFGLEMGR